MRHAATVLYSLLIAGLLSTNALASEKGHLSQVSGGELPKTQTNLNSHLEALQNYEAATTDMKKRIQLHKTRLANLATKPHLDPKGFLRFSAKLLSSHLESEVEKMEQRISWHQEQIRQLQSCSEEPVPLVRNEARM